MIVSVFLIIELHNSSSQLTELPHALTLREPQPFHEMFRTKNYRDLCANSQKFANNNKTYCRNRQTGKDNASGFGTSSYSQQLNKNVYKPRHH